MSLHERADPSLVEERRRRILSELQEQGRVVSGELSRRFEVSEDTVRRDLREMSAAGLLQRVHGGALPCAPVDTPFTERLRQDPGVKRALAQTVVGLLRDGQVITLGGGTTCVEIARQLPLDLAVTIVTNSPTAAVELAAHPLAEVVLIGGTVNKRSLAVEGAAALRGFERVRADVCILGVCSLDAEFGLTTSSHEEAELQHVMLASAADVVAAVTTEKLGVAMPYCVAAAADLTHVATESNAPEALLAPLRDLGLKVLREAQ